MTKKILIVSAFFEEKVGYQEVQLAQTLTEMSHEVKVLATDRSNLNADIRYENSKGNYEVIRIKNHYRIKSTFYIKENLKFFFEGYSPDIVFLILPGTGLPYFILKYLPQNLKVISVYSDTTIKDRVAKAKGTKGNQLVFKVLKHRWYNKVMERSDILIANTNETVEILKNISKKNIDAKLRMTGLGYSSQNYFYSPELRKKFRDEIGLDENQKLIVTVTRVYTGKPFDYWVEQMQDFLGSNENFVYLLAGFSDDEFSLKVRINLEKLGLGKKLILYNFTTPEKNNEIFNAADFSLWFAPTISIQQSMATGLLPIIPFDSTLDHLIENNKTGIYYKDFMELKEILTKLPAFLYDRLSNVEVNKRFSYNNILKKIISEVS